MKRVLTLFAFLVVAYGAICAWTFFQQRSFIYFPRVLDTATVDANAKSAGLEPWTAQDGTRLGWKIPDPQSPAHSFVFFHGNGGLAIEENLIAAKLRKNNPQSSIYLLEYPGYANMPGEPSEKSIVDQACLAVDDITAKTTLPLYLVGQSLGTGVACETGASRKSKVSGLLLLTPFDGIASVASSRRPYLPVRLLLRERFDSVLHLRDFDKPISVVIAENDAVILPKFGIALYTGYTGPKKMVVIPGSGHNDAISIMSDSTLRELLDFLQHPKAQPDPSVAALSAP